MAEGDSINKRIQDRAIRHAIYLDRFHARVSEEVLGYLNREVYPDLLAKLEARLSMIRLRGFDSGFETTKSYLRMLDDLGAILEDGHKEAAKRVREIARELAKVEARWQTQVLLDTVPEDAHALVQLDRRVNLSIVQAVVHRPMQGKVTSEWWGDLSRQTAAKLQAQIGVGLAQGETQDQIVRRVRGTKANGFRDGVLNVERQQAAAIVRTTTATVANNATMETLRGLKSVLRGVKWLATLDTKTCPICGPMDGKVFDVDDPSLPQPPLHWGCRCKLSPVVKSFRELAGLKPRAASGVSDRTRDSIDGQVPADVTWSEWIEQQPAARQDEIFGAGRARLFRAGKITAKDLATRTGRIRTLAELERS